MENGKSLLITPTEACELLHCTPRTLIRWAKKLKFARLGRNYVRLDVERKIANLMKDGEAV